MALLGCRTAGDVYEVAADFMLLLAPGAVVIVNEASPDLEWLTTRAIRGMDESLLAKAADLVGFEMIGKRSAILPIHRDEMLGGTLSTIPEGFADSHPPRSPAGLRRPAPGCSRFTTCSPSG